MADVDAEVKAQIDLLTQQYARRLPEKIARIEETWAAFQQSWDSETRDVLQRMIHSLVGSGASFGFPALTDRARELEYLIKAMTAGGFPPSNAQIDHFVALLEALKRSARRRGVTSELPPLDPPPATRDVPPREASQAGKAIFLLEEDGTMAQDMARQIGYFGYQVFNFTSLVALKAAARQSAPAAVIMDIVLPEGNYAEDAMLKDIAGAGGECPPLIFISSRGDMAARLQAVRAGGDAYFNKPLDVGALIDKLDKLTTQQASEPYRVLIVDDEPSLAAYHSHILRRAGMAVSVVNDPLEVMAPLIDLKPDLILMDMYMPGMTGMELAAVIRQQEAYVSIPIVFLSAETDMGKQLLAMQLGGDDFLTKPIKPDHLISAVKSRVERLRILRSFMVRDSLTGLLNHTFMKQQLEVEVARSRRRGAPLSFAIIDIDHFKSVNDTHGHPTGDRVIKSLSRMLKQRLRETDLIGRYGGEEFAIILPDTESSAARKVLDELRAGFGQIRHIAADEQFYVTFSGGLASLPDYEDAAALNDAADKALYQAKQEGRNRVVVAE